jgi:hypothetical protein
VRSRAQETREQQRLQALTCMPCACVLCACVCLVCVCVCVLVCLQLDKHRPIIMLFFELLTGFYRVMTLLGSIQERKAVIATYTTANSMASESTDVVGVSE